MVATASGKAYENTQMSAFLRARIDELAGRKSQREIAAEAGYDKPNIISMFKRGETKVPFDKLPVLAKALEVDVMVMVRLYLDQPGGWEPEVVGPMFSRLATMTEGKVLNVIRAATDNKDPSWNDKELAELEKAVRKIKPAAKLATA